MVASDGDNNGVGVVYVYTGSGSSWTYVATLSPSDGGAQGASDAFGYSVAVSSGLIVVGSVLHNYDGAVFVYQNGGSYGLEAEYQDPGAGYHDFFGSTVGITSSSTVVAGAPFENTDEGAVFAYTAIGGNWPATPTDTLTAPGGSPGYGDLFGEGLAVSSKTVVIGAPGAPGATAPPTCNGSSAGAGCSTGAVYVYKELSSGFQQEAKLTAPNGEGCSATCSSGADNMGGDYFGWAVAIVGRTLAVSAPWASVPPAPDGGTSTTPNSTGTAYAFTGSGGSWTEEQELYDPAEVTNGGQDWFGYHVAVGPARSIVATAPYDPEGSATGAAFVFPKQGGTWPTFPTELNAPDGGPNDYFGDGNTVSNGTLYVLIGGPGGLYIFKK